MRFTFAGARILTIQSSPATDLVVSGCASSTASSTLSSDLSTSFMEKPSLQA